MIPSIVDDLNVVRLELANQSRVILLTWGDGVIQDLLNSPRIELLLGFICQPL